MKLKLQIVSTLVCSALLASCGSGDNTGGGVAAQVKSCVGSFSGGNTSVTASSSCTACSNRDRELSIDGRGDTYAVSALFGGTYTIRATAQTGILYPAGNFAGAFMRIPQTYSPGSTWTISTFKGGVMQETRSTGNAAGDDPANPSGTDNLYGLTTTMDFDSVGISLTGGSTNMNDEIRIYEFCSRR